MAREIPDDGRTARKGKLDVENGKVVSADDTDEKDDDKEE